MYGEESSFMKRKYFMIAVMAAALGMTACSSQKTETEAATATTAASSAAETTTAEASSEEEESETENFYGIVKTVEDTVITVTDDAGTEAGFDVSGAELTGAEAIGEGDEVDVYYTGALGETPAKAVEVDIVISAAEEAEEEAA